MLVIGKRLANSEPAHHGERNLVDDSCLPRFTAGVRFPSLFPVVLTGENQTAIFGHDIPPIDDAPTDWTASRCIATFEENIRGRDDRNA